MKKHEIICENCDKKKKTPYSQIKKILDGVKLQTYMENQFIFVLKIVNLIMFLCLYYQNFMQIVKKL